MFNDRHESTGPIRSIEPRRFGQNGRGDVDSSVDDTSRTGCPTIARQQALLHSKDSDLQAKSQTIDAKDQAIDAKDFNIAALTHELAYYKRIRYKLRNEAVATRCVRGNLEYRPLGD
ncbi:MAG: hypothetical protein KGZ80_00810 [Methylomonas sp.]|nr:hypothetical protein [Methylomonas sp.]